MKYFSFSREARVMISDEEFEIVQAIKNKIKWDNIPKSKMKIIKELMKKRIFNKSDHATPGTFYLIKTRYKYAKDERR